MGEGCIKWNGMEWNGVHERREMSIDGSIELGVGCVGVKW